MSISKLERKVRRMKKKWLLRLRDQLAVKKMTISRENRTGEILPEPDPEVTSQEKSCPLLNSFRNVESPTGRANKPSNSLSPALNGNLFIFYNEFITCFHES